VAFRVYLVACAALLAWGASVRDENYVSSGFGLGYALGVVGLAFMTLLLLYSVRKRAHALAGAGPLRHWFGTHMMLGILGPVAILFHANFRPGSTNSSVALVCMLLVAGSGIVGRLIYPKLHEGLYGRRADVRALERAAAARRGALGAGSEGQPALARALAALEALAHGDPPGLLSALVRLVRLERQARAVRRLAARVPGGPAALEAYVGAVRRVVEFAIYERFFASWHAFHLPLCFLLFLAAAVHVVAAHMY
jgi:hypothetical protein